MTILRRRLGDYALLILAFGLGAWAVALLRRPWATEPQAIWLWGLLLAAGLLGGYALRHMQEWLPEGVTTQQPEVSTSAFQAPSEGTQKAEGRLARFRTKPTLSKACLFGAVVLTAWVVWKLWPDYVHWDGTLVPWLVALVLIALAGWSIGTIDPSPSRQPDPAQHATRNTPHATGNRRFPVHCRPGCLYAHLPHRSRFA